MHRSALIIAQLLLAGAAAAASVPPTTTSCFAKARAHEHCGATFGSDAKTAITTGNVEIIDIDPVVFAPKSSFYKSWEEAFSAASSPLFAYNAKDDPEKALTAVHDAYAFVARWLPRNVLAKLASFPFQKDGPSALVIRGLPIDAEVPPTPTKTTVFDSVHQESDRSTLVPVAESWLLGVTRILGIPVAAPFSKGDRGGLVRDITQNPDDAGDLPMHRDYPTLALQSPVGEPEILILFGVRSDAGDDGAQTVVMDSARLLQAIKPSDLAILKESTIVTEIELPTGDWIPISKPFNAIQDDEDGNTVVTLHNLPKAKYLSPDGGAATVEAYERVSRLAFDMGERINLRPGDVLVIQNSRLVHGRTKFNAKETCCNGSGRWLVKSYASNRLWRIPGSAGGGLVDYPNFSSMDWKGPGGL